MPYFIAFAPLGIPECLDLLRLRALKSANAWLYCVCGGLVLGKCQNRPPKNPRPGYNSPRNEIFESIFSSKNLSSPLPEI